MGHIKGEIFLFNVSAVVKFKKLIPTDIESLSYLYKLKGC